MPQDWKPLLDLANSLTVVVVLALDLYVLVFSGKLNTSKHTDDVVAAERQRTTDVVASMNERITDLVAERDRAVVRDEASRRELAENTATLARMETTVRASLEALARRR